MKTVRNITKNSFSLLLLIGLAAFSHCGCPNDFLLGDLQMKAPQFFPLKGWEKFTFVNRSGDEIIFDQFQSFTAPLVMHSLCSDGLVDSQIAYYNTGGQFFNYTHNNSNTIGYQFSIKNEIVNPTSPADTILYDFFQIQSPGNNEFSYVVSNRGNVIDQATKEINDAVRIIADTTLNGNQYTDLYCNKNNPTLYYSTAHGVVLFLYNGDWWHLKR